MIQLEGKLSREPEELSLGGNGSDLRLIELQAENKRLQRIVNELLIRNQQLRERASANGQAPVATQQK